MVKNHSQLDVSEGEVLRQINTLKNYVVKHSEDIPDRLYKAMSGISQTFLAFQKGKGAKGWASQAVDELGSPLWDSASAEIIENATPLLFLQGGGGLKPGDIQFGPGSSFVTKSVPDSPLSIDELYANARSYLQTIDDKNKELAAIVGPVALINTYADGEIKIGPYPPYLPMPIPVPSKLVVTLTTTFLESLRLLVSSNVLDIPFLRKILSIVLAFYDVIRGEWKDGILTFLGFFSDTWMIYGMTGKLMRWMYSLISPDIQMRIEEDLFAGGKSMIIGFWLWVLGLVSPKYVREMINEMIRSATKPLETINEQIAKVEAQAQASAAHLGARVKFPRVPLEQIPSFDDIQNFQSIVHRPEIFCNPVFQQAIAPAMSIAPLRVALELMNIPTTPEKIAEKCANQPASISEAITQTLKPTVTLNRPLLPK
jgi:hypothetical protein